MWYLNESFYHQRNNAVIAKREEKKRTNVYKGQQWNLRNGFMRDNADTPSNLVFDICLSHFLISNILVSLSLMRRWKVWPKNNAHLKNKPINFWPPRDILWNYQRTGPKRRKIERLVQRLEDILLCIRNLQNVAAPQYVEWSTNTRLWKKNGFRVNFDS